jgi:2-polyprenyl-3-methyl-5-hydroxy-6-metoxy-1,4-benzoquinol methylase
VNSLSANTLSVRASIVKALNESAVSFRDPAGRLFFIGDRVIRFINDAAIGEFEACLASPSLRQFVASGRLVATEALSRLQLAELREEDASLNFFATEFDGVAVEHERIPFRSFPYEWPPEMLHAAGELTLDLAENLLPEGLGLKDATPYNVLFRGSKPVHVDLLSFEQREAGDPTWLPFAQFSRTVLLPLLANKHFGIKLNQALGSQRDGLEPEQVYRLCRPLQKLRPPFLTLASLPSWLSRRQKAGDTELYQRRHLANPEKAQFILDRLFKRLRQELAQVAPSQTQRSGWSNYMSSESTSVEGYLTAKEDFVDATLVQIAPRQVLDVGCNTGHFSALAAARGARVVSIDSDAVVVSQVWRRAMANDLDILPLVVDLSRPTPAIGWRNRECPSFLERAAGAFDLVLMLAVLHHLLVSERIPLAEVMALAAELTTDCLIIEFIPRDDPMFRRITRGRDELFGDFDQQAFERTCERNFTIVQSKQLGKTSRRLYLLKKKCNNHHGRKD